MATEIYKQNVKLGPEGQRQVYEERITRDDAATVARPAVRRNSGVSLVYLLLDIVEVLLAARLVFRLLAANPGNGFVAFLYQITDPLLIPFRGAFASTVNQGTVIEWSTILAMVVYAVIAYVIAKLIDMGTRPTATR